jgi:hypothetical protein
MKVTGQKVHWAVMTVVLLGAHAGWADDASQGFTGWMNGEIDRRVTALREQAKVAVSSRSNSNQSETPSASTNASSLLDTTSASDLVGLAIDAAGLTAGTANNSDEGDATSGAVTVSAYALYSAAAGQDPLAPENYCGSTAFGPARIWRQFSFQLGFDDDDVKRKDGSGKQTSPIVAGIKAVLWTKRDVCTADFSSVQTALEGAGQQFSKLTPRIEDSLWERYHSGGLPAVPAGMQYKQFLNALEDPGTFTAIRARLGDGGTTLLPDTDLAAFVELDRAARKAIDDFRQQPQLSVSFTTKQRREGDGNEYRAAALFDYGLNDRLTLNTNASFELKDTDKDTSEGGRVAAALVIEPFADPLVGPKPLRITIGGEGKWMANEPPIYKGQLKVNLPIPRVEWLSGFEIPISVTVANRTELVDEDEVRGMVGFTIDTTQVLAAFRQ